jgi:pentatricopeptide repeat protein
MFRQACSKLARSTQPYARLMTSAAEESSAPALSTAQLALRAAVLKLGSAGQWQDVLASMQAAQAAEVSMSDKLTLITAVKAFGAGKQLQHAFEVIEAAKLDGLELDFKLYDALIIACGRSGDWRSALHVHAQMKQAGLEPSTQAYTATMNACCLNGQGQQAVDLFTELQAAGLQPALSTYNAAMRAYACISSHAAVLQLMAEMERLSVEPDAHSFKRAMHACNSSRQPQRALALLRQMQSRNVAPSSDCYNEAVQAYQQLGQGRAACRLLHTMQQQGVAPDAYAYSCAISACRAEGEWLRAAQLLQEMQQAGVEPAAGCYNSVLAALYKAGKVQHVLELLAEMHTAAKATTYSYNTGMAACNRAGKHEQALEILQQLRGAAGLQLDAHSYTTALQAADKLGLSDTVSSLLQELRDSGLVLSEQGYSSAILSCKGSKQWQQALQLLREAQQADSASARCYSAAMIVCSAAEQWQQSVELLHSMQQQQFVIDTVTCLRGITAHCHLEQWSVAVQLLALLYSTRHKNMAWISRTAYRVIITSLHDATAVAAVPEQQQQQQQQQLADELYSEAVQRGVLQHWSSSSDSSGSTLDIRKHSTAVAVCAVRCALQELQERGIDDIGDSGLLILTEPTAAIAITAVESESSADDTAQKTVSELLRKLGIVHSVSVTDSSSSSAHSSGGSSELVVSRSSLEAYLKQQQSVAPAALGCEL